jgi:hypothetical protein
MLQRKPGRSQFCKRPFVQEGVTGVVEREEPSEETKEYVLKRR